MLIFSILPILAAFGLSFVKWTFLSPPKWAGLANFQRLLGDKYFWNALKTGEAGQVRMAQGGTATPSMVKYAQSADFLDPNQPPEHRSVLIDYTPDEIYTYPAIPKMGEMWDAWNQELSEMWLGQKSVEDSVTAFCERIEPVLSK